MELYTCQISKKNKVESLGIPCMDITVKSGVKTFAPTWDFLMEYKKDKCELKYTSKFIPLMRLNFKKDREYWIKVLRQDKLCIMCYCANGQFCHRLLLIDIFKKICEKYNISFIYKGELS